MDAENCCQKQSDMIIGNIGKTFVDQLAKDRDNIKNDASLVMANVSNAKCIYMQGLLFNIS
jgi:hypothetical protein